MRGGKFALILVMVIAVVLLIGGVAYGLFYQETHTSSGAKSVTSAERPHGTEGLYVVYDDYEHYADLVKNDGTFDRFAEFLNGKLKEPLDITFHFTSCDSPNAYYKGSTKELIVCYQLMEYLANSYSEEVQSFSNADELVLATLKYTVIHELGHALVDELDIPITGREEDAVDQLAIAFLAEHHAEDAIFASAIFFKIRTEEIKNFPIWDKHPMDEQRFYNILCWAYGKDPETYEKAISVGELPEGRAKYCDNEYELMMRSWTRLLEPHMNS